MKLIQSKNRKFNNIIRTHKYLLYYNLIRIKYKYYSEKYIVLESLGIYENKLLI